MDYFFLFLVAGADSLLGHSNFFAQFSLYNADVDFSSWNSTYMLSSSELNLVLSGNILSFKVTPPVENGVTFHIYIPESRINPLNLSCCLPGVLYCHLNMELITCR